MVSAALNYKEEVIGRDNYNYLRKLWKSIYNKKITRIDSY
jgi:hypothetical protein